MRLKIQRCLLKIHVFVQCWKILTQCVGVLYYFKSRITIVFHLALFRDWARKNHLELHSCMLWVKLLSNGQNTTQTTKVFEAVSESLFSKRCYQLPYVLCAAVLSAQIPWEAALRGRKVFWWPKTIEHFLLHHSENINA